MTRRAPFPLPRLGAGIALVAGALFWLLLALVLNAPLWAVVLALWGVVALVVFLRVQWWLSR